jgi:hypothetical protein
VSFARGASRWIWPGRKLLLTTSGASSWGRAALASRAKQQRTPAPGGPLLIVQSATGLARIAPRIRAISTAGIEESHPRICYSDLSCTRPGSLESARRGTRAPDRAQAHRPTISVRRPAAARVRQGALVELDADVPPVPVGGGGLEAPAPAVRAGEGGDSLRVRETVTGRRCASTGTGPREGQSSLMTAQCTTSPPRTPPPWRCPDARTANVLSVGRACRVIARRGRCRRRRRSRRRWSWRRQRASRTRTRSPRRRRHRRTLGRSARGSHRRRRRSAGRPPRAA